MSVIFNKKLGKPYNAPDARHVNFPLAYWGNSFEFNLLTALCREGVASRWSTMVLLGRAMVCYSYKLSVQTTDASFNGGVVSPQFWGKRWS